MAHGKKYLEAAKAVDRDKRYAPDEAVELAKKTAFTKFDAPVELHLTMGADPKQADQQVRGVAQLPHGLGKKIRVLAFAQGEAARAAQDAGADFIGDDDMVKKIEGGWADFEVAVATPDMMGKVGRLGKVLGRKGLMPNPRAGTVVPPADLARAIGEAKKGRVEFRLDKTGIIHTVIGRASFGSEQLRQNLASVMEAINNARPTGLKGHYIKAASVNASMGPGVPVDVAALGALKAK